MDESIYTLQNEYSANCSNTTRTNHLTRYVKENLIKLLTLTMFLCIGLGFTNSANAQVADLYSSGGTTICAGESTTIAVSISASVGPYIVVYNDGSSDHSVSNYSSDETSDDDITVSPTTTTTYSLVSVHDSFGTNLLPLSSNTVTITVNPVPTNINVTLDPEAPICPGVDFDITATSTDGSTYQVWNEAGTVNLGSTTYTTSISNTTNYILKAISTASCVTNYPFTVQIDNVNPEITCPVDQTLNVDAGTCNATLPDYTTLVTVSDNCTAEGSIVLTQSPVAASILSGGHGSTQLITITATDATGNSADCTFTVTVNDNELPVLSNCPIDIDQDTDSGDAGAIVTWIEPSATDNCTASGSLTWTKSHNTGDFFDVGATTVTYTATDGAGNISLTCTFDVTIIDNEDPEITCPSNISVNNDPSVCGANVTYTAPVGTDNFPGVSTAQIAGLASGSIFPVGITTNTFKVTDAYGNTAECSFTVEVTDNENPQIACISNITANVDAGDCTTVVTYTAPIGTDNCPGLSTAQTAGLASGAAFPVGTTTNTFVVTDAAGLIATCSFDVIITDNIDPEITCPGNVLDVADSGNCTKMVTYTAPVGTDNCAGASTVQTAGLASGSLFPVGTTVNTFEVTDASGNTAECSFSVIISDDQIPSIVDCPSNISQTNDNNNCSAVVTWVDPTATDNCTSGVGFTWNKSHTSGSTFDVGTTTVTYTVEDEAGNTSVACTFDVTVSDDQAPDILACPADITRSNTLDECQSVVSWTEPSALDNCTSVGNIVWTKSHDPGDVFAVGTTLVTYSAEDEAGNSSNCTFNVTVLDNQKPVISACPSNISQASDAGSCSATVTWSEPTGSDNCTTAGNLVWTKSHTSGSVFSTGTATVTYTAEDEAGNVSLTCSFDITIADAVDPIAACQDLTVYLDSDGEASITAADVNDGSSDNCSLDDVSINITNFDCGDLGANTVILTATDAVSNTATCTSTVTVLDNISPVLTSKPTPTTKYVDNGSCVYTISNAEFDPDYTDNCAVTLLTYTLDGGSAVGTDETTSLSGITLTEGDHDFVWTAYDASSNVSNTWEFTVTVVDNQSPQIGPMANKFRSTNTACTYVVSGTEFDVSVTDNCGSNTLTYKINTDAPVVATTLNGVVLAIGTNTILWSATDGTNTSTRSFVVSVSDNEAPSIQSLSDVTVNSAANCQASVTWTAPTVSDNCTASPTLTQIVGPASGSTFNLGTTIIKYKAIDDAGNSSEMQFNVIVENNNPPTIVCPSGSPFSRSAPEGTCYYTVSGTEFNPTSATGCDVVLTNDYEGTSSLTSKQITGGTHTIIWTATDASSATSTCSIVVDIDSDQDLSFNTPTGHFDNYVDGGECYFTISGNDYDATDIPDACAGSSITVSGVITQGASTIYSGFTSLAGYQLAKGENYSIVWTITDGGGLSISSTPFTVSVFDNQEPTFTCYGNTTKGTDTGEAYYTISGTEFDPTSISDNCDSSFDISFTIDGSAGTGETMAGEELLTGQHTIIWTIEDQSGNSSECSFVITVEDNEAPEITTIADATRPADSGTCFYTATGGEFDPSYSDNVGVTEFINTVNNSSTLDAYEFPTGTTNVVWRATDAAGNVTTMEFAITVSDDEDPTYDLVASATRYVSSGCFYRVVGNEFNPTNISDNCTSSNFNVSNDYNPYSSLAYEDLPVGVTTVNWTVTDHDGNSSVEQVVITVLDEVSPVVYCPSSDYVRISDSGETYYTASGSEMIPYAYDNCSISTTSNDFNSGSTLAGEQLPEGSNEIVWTYTDASGNTNTCTTTVFVTNSLYPSVTCVSDQTRSTDIGECFYTISGDEFAPTVGSGITVQYKLGSDPYVLSLGGEEVEQGSHYIRCKATWTINGTDYSSYCGFFLTVTDDESPTITPLADIDVDASGCWKLISNIGTLVVTDNCSPTDDLVISNNSSDYTYYNNPNYYPIGDSDVTWTVTDEAGNTATYVQTITVNDVTAPSISCLPSDIYVEANDPTGTFYIGSDNEFDPSRGGDCSNPVSYTHNYSSASLNTTLAGESFPTGSTIVTWTAIDNEGNTNTCTFTIHVQSTVDPHVSCHGPKWRGTDAGLCTYDIVGTGTSNRFTVEDTEDAC